MPGFFLLLMFWFGAAVGSFLNVLALRLPVGQVPTGRSHCPHCRRTLNALDLVPLVSFLALRGRCRTCHARLSWQYFLVELTTATLFVLAVWSVPDWFVDPGQALELVRVLFAVSLAVVVALIDLRHMLILDKVVWTALGFAVAFVLLQDMQSGSLWSWHGQTFLGILSALVVSGFFGLQWLLSRGRWIGYGDVKFAIPFGFLLPWPLGLVALLLSYWIGALVAVPLLLMGRGGNTRLPFGVFLSASLVICVIFGKDLLSLIHRIFAV